MPSGGGRGGVLANTPPCQPPAGGTLGRPDPWSPAVKALSVLGSTGSIGTQTLELAEEFPDRFIVAGVIAASS